MAAKNSSSESGQDGRQHNCVATDNVMTEGTRKCAGNLSGDFPHRFRPQITAFALSISGILGGLGTSSAQAQAGEIGDGQTQEVLVPRKAAEIGTSDASQNPLFLPLSIPCSRVGVIGMGEDVLENQRTGVLQAKMPSTNVIIPTTHTLSKVAAELGLVGHKLQAAYTYAPSECMQIGSIGQFRTIIVFGDRRTGYTYVDVTECLTWSDMDGLVSLGGGRYMNTGLSRSDDTAQIRPDKINYSHNGSVLGYAGYGNVKIQGSGTNNRYSLGISAQLNPSDVHEVTCGDRVVNNVVYGQKGSVQIQVKEAFQNNQYPQADITSQAHVYIEPENGVSPCWVWYDGSGSICFSGISEPKMCTITTVYKQSRSTQKLYFLPEAPVQELQIIVCNEACENKQVPVRVIAHYPDGWTSRDVTKYSRISGKGFLIQPGDMGSDLCICSPSVDHKELETFSVGFVPYAPIKYVSGKEMDYNLSLLTHLGVNAIGTYTVLPEEDPSEFIQVSYLENGKQVTELIHRDDYDTVMAQRNGEELEDTQTSQTTGTFSGTIPARTLSSSEILTSIETISNNQVQYGNTVQGARLGVSLSSRQIITGQSIEAHVWYQYQDLQAIDISSTLEVKTDSPWLEIVDNMLVLRSGLTEATTAHIWSETTFQGQKLKSAPIEVTLLPMLFEVSARSDTVNAGGSVDTVAQVQAGESVNNITNLVTWTCPVGSIQNGVYKAPNTVQTDTTIYLTASFRYAGRVYEASVPIKLLGSPQEMAGGADSKTGANPNALNSSDQAIAGYIQNDIHSLQKVLLGYAPDRAAYEYSYARLTILPDANIAEIAYEITLRSAALYYLSTLENSEALGSQISAFSGEMVALLDILLSKVRLEQDMTEVFLILQEGLSAPNKQLLESTELIPDLNQLLQEYGLLGSDISQGEGIQIEESYIRLYASSYEPTEVLSSILREGSYDGISSADEPYAEALKHFLPGTRTTQYSPSGYEYCELTFVVDYYDGYGSALSGQLYPAQVRYAYKTGPGANDWYTSQPITVSSFDEKQKAFDQLWVEIRAIDNLEKNIPDENIVEKLIYASDQEDILRGSLAFFPFMEDAKDATTQGELPTGFRVIKTATHVNGLDLKIYYNDLTREVVIATGGSDEFWADWVGTDAALLSGNTPQFRAALIEVSETIELLQNNSNVYRVICIGHSLGGAVAEYIGQSLDLPTLTFGAPGIDKDSWEHIIHRNPEMNARSLRVIVVDDGYQDPITLANVVDDQKFSPGRNVRIIKIGSYTALPVHGTFADFATHKLENYKNSINQ